jgi:hypothetical protein
MSHDWKDEAKCRGWDLNLFFDTYEEDIEIRRDVDEFCASCPVRRECFATGVSQKAVGVWGGIYLDGGKISREFNRHKTKDDWANTWSELTNDKE